MEIFQNYAYYYNLFYGNKDYSLEANQIKTLVEKYCGTKKISSILNLGCGTGKHDFELCRLGYEMTGVDLSESMIKIANKYKKQSQYNPAFHVADIREYIPEKTYDAVISMFHVMSYQNSNEDVLKTFKTANEALDKGGIFIFDAWYGPGVLSDKPSVRTKKVIDEENTIIRLAIPKMHADKDLVDVCYEVLVINNESSHSQKIEEIHHMRYFFKPEIELMLKMSGFTLLSCLDCNSLNKTDYNSWTAYFVAIKNN